MPDSPLRPRRYYWLGYLLCPFIVGLVLGLTCGWPCAESDVLWLLLPILLTTLIALFSSHHAPRVVLSLLLPVVMLTIGGTRGGALHPKRVIDPLSSATQSMLIITTTAPDSTEWGWQQEGVVIGNTTDGNWQPAWLGTTLRYGAEADLPKGLNVGDTLLLNGRYSPTRTKGNPHAFSTSVWLQRRGIRGAVRVTPGSVTLLGKGKKGWLHGFTQLRERMLSRLRALGLEGDTYGLIAAMTVGDKRDLPRQHREEFATTGIAHILALSGLHAGFVYAIVAALCRWFVEQNLFSRILRHLLPVVLIWFFAAIAGFSPSLVRATTMITVVALGRFFRAHISSIESLLLAASVILFFTPEALFDVGFQLSFTAILGIFAFTRPLSRLVKSRSKIAQFFWNLLSLSIGAQLGTLPVLLYNFGALPVLGLIANLFAVPLATIIVPGGLFLLLLPPGYWISSAAVWCMELVVWVLVQSNRLMAQLPYAQLEGVRTTLWESIILATTMTLLALLAMRRRRVWLWGFIGTLCLFGTIFGIRTFKTYREQELVVFHAYGRTLLCERTGRAISYWPTDCTPQDQRILKDYGSTIPGRIIRPLGVETPLKNDYSAPHAQTLTAAGWRLLVMSSSDSVQSMPVFLEKAAVLIVSAQPQVPLVEILKQVQPEVVIFDGGIAPWIARKYIDSCSASDIHTHSTYDSGAYIKRRYLGSGQL